MFDSEFFQRAIILAPVFFFSLTVHEFFHAWTANKFGDPTAKNMGRLTLNPLAHLDLMGTLVMVMSGFTFGWAKPVPVNPMNLRDPRMNDIWISAAGPLSNIGIAIIAGILYQIDRGMAGIFPEAFMLILYHLVVVNCMLAIFNMVPLFPLDGSHILRHMMGPKHDHTFDQLERVAPFILLFLIISGGIGVIVGGPIRVVASLLLGFFW